MDMNWKAMVAQTAPLLGSWLAGPVGAGAGKMLGKALLDNENAKVDDIESALANPTPEQLLALKQLEADLQVKLAQLHLDTETSVAKDRDSARQREIQVHDKIPALLAILLTVGFFSILFAIIFFPMSQESSHIIDVMLGALGTAWVSCITYYFGSSYGSHIKNQFLSARGLTK